MCVSLCISHIIPTLQEELDVPIEESLVGRVVLAEVLQEHVSRSHYVPHTIVLRLQCEYIGGGVARLHKLTGGIIIYYISMLVIYAHSIHYST